MNIRMAECHPDRAYYAKGQCHNCWHAAWRAAHPEALKEHKRREYAKNRSRYQTTSRAYYVSHREQVIAKVNAWHEANPERRRASALRRVYNLTPEDYRNHLVGQAGRCLVCGRVPRTDLVVDHDHTTGQFRGLLCHAYNWGLGHFADDPVRLRNAAKYVGTVA